MKSVHRAAVLFDAESLQPALRNYIVCLLQTLGSLLQVEPYYNLAALHEGVPGAFRHYLRFQETGAGTFQDLVIYHMSANNPGDYIYSYLSRYPGVVIFYGDYTASVKYADAHGDSGLFMAEMKRAYGKEGENIVKSMGDMAPEGFYYRKYPLYPAVLESAPAIVTYTEFEQKRLTQRFPGKKVIRVPVPFEGKVKKPSESINGTGKSGSAIMHLGPVRSERILESITTVLSALKRNGCPVTFILPVRDEAEKKIIQAKKYRRLRDMLIPVSLREGRTLAHFSQRCHYFMKMEEARTLEEWWQILEAFDSGRAVFLADLPEFSDLPDDICIKVRPGRDREKELFSLISLLSGEEAPGREIASRARRFLQQVHHPGRVRRAMGDLFTELLKGKKRKAGRGPTDVQKVQAETINTLFEEALSSLHLEHNAYLQKELTGMLKWGY